MSNVEGVKDSIVERNLEEEIQSLKKQLAHANAKLARKDEGKSKRIQLVMKPSVYKLAKKKAADMEISFNEYVHRLVEEDIGDTEEF